MYKLLVIISTSTAITTQVVEFDNAHAGELAFMKMNEAMLPWVTKVVKLW